MAATTINVFEEVLPPVPVEGRRAGRTCETGAGVGGTLVGVATTAWTCWTSVGTTVG
jgi:hypothetical protein